GETALRQRLDLTEQHRAAEQQDLERSLSDHRQLVQAVEAELKRERTERGTREAAYQEAEERFAADNENLTQGLAEARRQAESAHEHMGELARQLDCLREELDGKRDLTDDLQRQLAAAEQNLAEAAAERE